MMTVLFCQPFFRIHSFATVLALLVIFPSVSSFVVTTDASRRPQLGGNNCKIIQHQYPKTTATTSTPATVGSRCSLLVLRAVTEEQVLAAVEEAEALWAKALEARKNADEAAGKAEAIRAAAADGGEEDDAANGDDSSATSHETSHISPKVLSLASLADGMEADEFIKQAEDFSKEADEIEAKAEKALEETEKLLEQHVKDFPDSPLAEE